MRTFLAAAALALALGGQPARAQSGPSFFGIRAGYGYHPVYGFGYSGPSYHPSFGYARGFGVSGRIILPGIQAHRVPLAGIHTAPLAAGPRAAGRAPAERTAGSRQETARDPIRRTAGPEPDGAAARLRALMERGPVTEGTVNTVGATGLLVEYSLAGKPHTERFDPDQVFFFLEEGGLASAATRPAALEKGDRVLIPLQPDGRR